MRMTWAEITHPDDLAKDVAEFNRVLSGEMDGYAIDKRFIHRDGHVVYTYMAVRCVRREDGSVEYFVALVEDISARKQVEMTLQAFNETLEQRIREETDRNMAQERLLIQQSRLAAMGEMIGNIAHQWRQPINALTLLLGNLKDAYEHNELDKNYLDKAVKDGQTIIQRMSATIDDFRNFFRPNKEKTCFSVNEAVADVLRILGATFKNSGIAVFVKGDEDVMSCGYRNEYSQVLINLMSNAKEALQERKIADGCVHITISRRDALSEVIVEDNAGGIPADVLPRVFDPYFTTKEKGSGIGLYMSKMIIENSMDGHIEVRNTGEGARFTLTTPSGAA